jgi:hypothetical protein
MLQKLGGIELSLFLTRTEKRRLDTQQTLRTPFPENLSLLLRVVAKGAGQS